MNAIKGQKIIGCLWAAILAGAFGMWAMQAGYCGLAMLAAGVSCCLFLLCALGWSSALDGGLKEWPSPDAALGKRSLRWSRRHPWAAIALGVLGLRLALYVLAYWVDLGVNGYSGGLWDGLARLWLRTDSPSYLGIAENWYVTTGDARFHIVFFPLYPLCIRVVNWLLGNTFAAAMAVSNLFAVGSGILLYELAALDLPRRDALYTTALAMVFPGAMFLGAPMTESLFLFLCLGCVLLGRKGRFLLAALAAALAGFTRSVGVLLAVYLGVEMLVSLVRRPEKRLARVFGYLGCLLVACLGTLAYLGVNAAVTGDPFTFLTYQKEHWSQSLSLFFNTAAYQTEYLLNSLAAGETRMAWGLYIPNLVCGFGALGIMVPGVKKLRPGDGAFFLAYYGVAMGCTWLLSAPRYLAVCYPLALGLGALAQGKANWLRWSLLGCMFLLQVGYTCLYILGFPVY